MNTIYTIISTICFFGIGYIYAYFKGKQSKETEIINNNNKLQNQYANNKNHINNSDTLSDKLQNGKY
ncbi:MAG: hypothetical protein GX638_02705 [Crenarchaeota archaeon]|nr:hypothetical protein [Thermoproteota archaeon]